MRGKQAVREEAVRVRAGNVDLEGDLLVPPAARGLVLFAHGSGSSRFSPRNRKVASVLHQARLGTLLIDLLTEPERSVDDYTARLRFNIPLLGRRMVALTDWAAVSASARGLPIGLFGASTGAAAALVAAAERPERVAAVVSRGGRPDLAGEALEAVRCPVLLIVGGEDLPVLDLNRRSAARLAGPHELRVVRGATHLFEEPGKLEQVAELAGNFFLSHLHSTVHGTP